MSTSRPSGARGICSYRKADDEFFGQKNVGCHWNVTADGFYLASDEISQLTQQRLPYFGVQIEGSAADGDGNHRKSRSQRKPN